MEQLENEVNDLKEKLISMRRDLHRFPEQGWGEYRTAAFIAECLQRLGFKVETGKKACNSDSRMGVPDDATLRFYETRALDEGANPDWIEKMTGGHTAVVGIIHGEKPGPTIALRFDMDCNELTESGDSKHFPARKGFASAHQGLMHACGHDGHISIGLGVAHIIARFKAQLVGEVRLLFQPAEEGCRGAKSMVDAGWLNNVDYFFSGHIAFKSFKLGEIIASTTGFMATSKMDVVFSGNASHAGEAPEQGKNALTAAASSIMHLHGISRHSKGATRINVGRLEAGSGRNIVAEHALLKLETRGETEELNDYMMKQTIRIIENMARVYDVSCAWELVGQALDSNGSPELIPWIEQEAAKIINITSFVPNVRFGASEDVTFMLNKVLAQGGKGSYLLFGSPLNQGHHQSQFDFDEEVLTIAVQMFSQLVFSCSTWTFST